MVGMSWSDSTDSSVLGVIAVMDTQSQALDEYRTRLVLLCPGCGSWQVEDIVDDRGCDPFLLRDAAEEHCGECTPLSLLAGLRALP